MAAVGPSGQNLEQICRLLLCGDDFSVAPLRTFCLQRLAFLFDALSSEDGPEQERTLFESFVVAVAPEVMLSQRCGISAALLQSQPCTQFQHMHGAHQPALHPWLGVAALCWHALAVSPAQVPHWKFTLYSSAGLQRSAGWQQHCWGFARQNRGLRGYGTGHRQSSAGPARSLPRAFWWHRTGP